jgi:hypothetical protein
MAWCEAERANLVAAVHQAARADPPHAAAWQLPNVLWWHLYLRKDSADWITATRRGLVAARRIRREAGNTYGQASTRHNLGDTLVRALALVTELGAPQAADVRAHLERLAGHRPAQGPVRSG